MQGKQTVVVSASKVDAVVWDNAAACLRDPDFFKRLLAESDAANGPAVRVASLTRQIQQAGAARDKLLKQLERLDPDDELVEIYQSQLRANKALREELSRDLDAAQETAKAEDARRATLAAFTCYADAERERLDAYTSLQRYNLLRALRTRVTVDRGGTLSNISIVFDLRHLPADEANPVFSPPTVDIDSDDFMDGFAANETIDLRDVPSVDILDSSAADEPRTSETDCSIEERTYR